MLQSSLFNPEAFLNVTEGQLLDRKVQLYRILADNRELAEFIRDVLALSNSARMLGQDAFILFGVTDDRVIIGIKGQDIRDAVHQLATKEDDASIEKFQGELVGRVLAEKVKEYIGDFGVTYEYGYFDEKLVSYLRMPGRTPRDWHDKPYQTLRKVIGLGKEEVLEEGYCMKRVGESNHRVNDADKSKLYCHSVMPFVKFEDWSLYSSNVLAEMSDSFVPGKMMLLHCAVEREEAYDVVVQDFLLDCVESGKYRKLLVCNSPGSGKTTTLKSIAANLAETLKAEADTSVLGGEQKEPRSAIPVYVSLQDYSSRHRGTVTEVVVDFLHKMGLSLDIGQDGFVTLTKNRNLRFVFLIDAIDEMINGDRENIAAVHGFVDRMGQNCRVILGCRSDRVSMITDLESYTRIELLPVQQRLMHDYLNVGDQVLCHIANLLEWCPELSDLLDRPFSLVAFSEYLEHINIDDHIPSDDSRFFVSSVIAQIIEYVIRREYNKHRITQFINDDMAGRKIHDVLEQVAYVLLRKRPYLPDDDLKEVLDWLVRATILTYSKRSKGYRFANSILYRYFAASAIHELIEPELSVAHLDYDPTYQELLRTTALSQDALIQQMVWELRARTERSVEAEAIDD